jgi:hypothetical protein
MLKSLHQIAKNILLQFKPTKEYLNGTQKESSR